jgi:photosystem II protein PsbQ
MAVASQPVASQIAVPSDAPAAPERPLAGLRRLLRSLIALTVAVLLSVSVSACSGASKAAPAISPEDMALITRQAEGFLDARNRLPELATLVNQRNWVFTRNLIHGPMQEVSREMLYINQRLLPADRPEAQKRAEKLKTALAQLDEAARLQDAENLRKAYIKVASGFGLYAQVFPPEVQEALKQV